MKKGEFRPEVSEEGDMWNGFVEWVELYWWGENSLKQIIWSVQQVFNRTIVCSHGNYEVQRENTHQIRENEKARTSLFNVKRKHERSDLENRVRDGTFLCVLPPSHLGPDLSLHSPVIRSQPPYFSSWGGIWQTMLEVNTFYAKRAAWTTSRHGVVSSGKEKAMKKVTKRVLILLRPEWKREHLNVFEQNQIKKWARSNL